MANSQFPSVDAMADEFEAEWKAGKRPFLGSYLRRIATPQRLEGLRELIRLELEYRLHAGEPACVEEYLTNYPEVQGDRQAVLDLIAHECRLKLARADPLSLGECLERFPQYGDELKRKLSFVQEARKQAMPTSIGDYSIEAILGEGNMGRVYLGNDARLGRKVAVKTMRPELASSDLLRQSFLREARSAASIRHEHIVTIYEVGEEGGVPFLAMPYLKGESLNARLHRESELPMVEAVRIAREIAEGLAAAHQAKRIHRDIKPANVWLETPGDKVKILDFGLARELADAESITASGMILGTPAFMSPEQARSEKLDPRSDLYSLGVLLYLMLTGKLPYDAANGVAMLEAAAKQPPGRPSRLRREVPPSIDRLVLELLAKAPEGRPEGANSVVDRLRKIEDELQDGAQGRPTASRTTMELAPNARKPKPTETRSEAKPSFARTWMWTGLSTAILALVAVPLVWFMIRNQRVAEPGTLVIVAEEKELREGLKGATILLIDTAGFTKKIPADEPVALLPQGDYRIQLEGVVDAKTDFDRFSIRGNEKVVVRLLRERAVPDLPVDPDPDRTAAKYVLSIGGVVQIDDVDQEIKTIAALPQRPFRLTTVGLWDNKKVDDAGLVAFRGCKEVLSITLTETPRVTDKGIANFSGCTKLLSADLRGTKITSAGLRFLKNCPDVSSLELSDTRFDDAGLETLKDCVRIDQLYLRGTQVGDAGLAFLKDRLAMRELDLSETRVTDAGLVHLNGFADITNLGLSKTKVSDAGFVHIAKCTKLTTLGLTGTRITEKSVKQMESFKALRTVALGGVKMRPEGFTCLKEWPDLDWLDLNDTEIRDEQIALLRDSKKLHAIHLGHTPVTDEGLRHLARIPSLQYVLVRDSRVTPAGIAELRKALPKCRVD